MLIVFDIDGTLADNTHRLRFIRDLPEGAKPDWEKYGQYTPFDEPIKPIIAVHNDLKNLGHTILYVTGRNDKFRRLTADWLRRHTVMSNEQDTLLMRRDHDFRPDFQIKEEILAQIIQRYGQKPDLVFEDRKQVVDMWRRHGIQTLQVADGEF